MKTFKLNPVYSDFTDADFSEMEERISLAQEVYDEALRAYNYSISVGNQSYAKRKRKPAMDAAYETLQNLLSVKETMQQSVSLDQNIGLVDLSAAQATGQADTASDNSQSWKTWAYAGGAIVVILIVYKLL